MPYTANGIDIIDAQIFEPSYGCWHADLELDTEADLSGAMSLNLEGVVFSAHILRGGIEGGRWLGRVIGGAGGLSATLDARSYISTAISFVLSDVLTEAGETSDPGSVDYSGHEVATWTRTHGKASHALAAAANEVGANWRISRSGGVLIAPDTFPPLDIEYTLTDQRPDLDSVIIAPTAADLVSPAVTFDGRRVSYVATSVEPRALRQTIWFLA